MTVGLKRALIVLALAGLWPAHPGTAHQLTIKDGHFEIDGQTIQILSGEMHYPRIPREYWRDRMKKARAMGLNTITTYVFWNLHEPKPNVFDFSGDLDVGAFVRTAQSEGLHVIVRPGPYVCSEWDLGGLPAWLLADHSMVLRSNDPKFLAAADRYMKRLGKELAPLQSTRGGPIIAVQVENEYGSFDNDAAYMRSVRDMIVASGLDEALLYTADGPGQLPAGTLPDLPAVVNFGPGGAERAFAALRRLQARRTADERRVLGRVVRSVGRTARAHQRRSAGARDRLDAGAGRIVQPLHVPRRHDVRVHERRQHGSDIQAADVELRLRRGARRIRPAAAEVLHVPRRDRPALPE